MEGGVRLRQLSPPPQTYPMKYTTKYCYSIFFSPAKKKLPCIVSLTTTITTTTFPTLLVKCLLCTGRSSSSSSGGGKKSAAQSQSQSQQQLKDNWLHSLSCPFPINQHPSPPVNGHSVVFDTETETETESESESESQWVIGVDPDLSGALALLKTDPSGCCSPQVFDSPHLAVLIGKRTRRRLDAKSIVNLLRSFNVPVGTTAYIEQSAPFPQDGKQGWWSGGFGYGLWIGILVASGFSVVPVHSKAWKNEFHLCGSRSSKDDSRELASALFPSMSSLLKRKKDHGRAEALLIAAYGKGLKMGNQII